MLQDLKGGSSTAIDQLNKFFIRLIVLSIAASPASVL